MTTSKSISAKARIVVICGPTGIGKTSTAIEIGSDFQAEIINADSMQIYRGMDIGTAKPTSEELAQVPHHMLDIIDPDQDFDAARYCRQARATIRRLQAESILPFVVGGSGLYIKALISGLFQAGASDPEVRRRLQDEAAASAGQDFYQRLSQCDPETAKKLHPHDTYRIVRALEVYEITQKSMVRQQKAHRFSARPFDVLKIGLHMERNVLYERINRRVDAMVGAGLLDEVQGLLARGFSGQLKSMRSIGYRHMLDFIQKRLTWEEALQTLKRDTRRYAKRQMTWFRADPQIMWMPAGATDGIKKLIQHFLHQV